MSGKVLVLMGSPSDQERMQGATEQLDKFGVGSEVRVLSAHRNADETARAAKRAQAEGYGAIICGAGMSAALPGTVAAQTQLPVIGVPLSGGGAVNELSAVLACAEMPPGVPVATVALDGSKNAALLAIRHLAANDPALARKYRGFMERGSDVRAPMPIHSGKVRDTFKVNGSADKLIQYASDRISVFDYVLDTPIPGKGIVLTKLSEFWLRQLQGIVPNHLVQLGVPGALGESWTKRFAERILLVRKLNMVPLECIVRGYLEGSAWREYQTSGTMHGQPMPEGMKRCQKLDEPTFTPSTKAPEGEHDENISIEQASEQLGQDLVARLKEVSLELYAAACEIAEPQGVIILDTKFEFGFDLTSKELTLADEVFTPDSSRFVAEDGFAPGQAPESMDKEYVRQWVLNESGWDKDTGEAPPPLPDYVVYETSRRYGKIGEMLTGTNPIENL